MQSVGFCCRIERYCFDLRDDDTLIEDEVAFEFPSIEVKTHAAKALIEIARDVMPGAEVRSLR
jgi:hypothetical protein